MAAILVDVMLKLQFTWDRQWFALAGLGVFLALPAWLWLPKPRLTAVPAQVNITDLPISKRFIRFMLLSYFCAGYGYVLSATFIVTIVERMPGLGGSGNLSFVIMGLAAAPAVLLWDLIARKAGYLNAIILVLFLQLIAILLPTLS